MARTWITGGKGFIGRNLGRHIASKGHAVFGVGHGLWPAEDALQWGFGAWCNGEIEAANLSQLMQVSGVPDVVYHLAGGSSVGASFQNPYEDFCRTVDSSARLFEWLRWNAPEARVVSVSSAAVYGAGHDGPISEGATIAPYSPYGTHKSMMESVCRSYAENFGLRGAIVRLFSVYGAGLEKQLLWDTCCKLAADESALLMLGGSGNELRDWLHVSDAAELLWLAQACCDIACPVVNGGTGIGTPIREVAQRLIGAWGGGHFVQFSGVARKGDPDSLVADCTTAAGLGFTPRVELDEGISEVVRWFKARS